MNVVVRETIYPKDFVLEESREFQEFQMKHASQTGYRGSTVTKVGDGRYITMTFWETSRDMDAAREALSPVVEQLLTAKMSAPSRLLGTGSIVYADVEIVRRSD